MKFSDFIKNKQLMAESMDYKSSLDFVLAKLRLPPAKEDNKDDTEMILTMPLKGYGADAIKSILQEPKIRELPNFQTQILPELTKSSTTVGRLVHLLSKGKKNVSSKKHHDNDVVGIDFADENPKDPL
jgi:hypothetical protein